MITSSNENIFRGAGPLWWKSTGHRWFPLAKVNDAQLWCFLSSAPEQAADAGDLTRHRAHYGVTVMLIAGVAISEALPGPGSQLLKFVREHSDPMLRPVANHSDTLFVDVELSLHTVIALVGNFIVYVLNMYDKYRSILHLYLKLLSSLRCHRRVKFFLMDYNDHPILWKNARILHTPISNTYLSISAEEIACRYLNQQLSHWGRDKMATISQTAFSNAFSRMEIYRFV